MQRKTLFALLDAVNIKSEEIYGTRHNLQCCLEELFELYHAISKALRKNPDTVFEDENVIEEIADMDIVLTYLKTHIDDDVYINMLEKKVLKYNANLKIV